jgi:hypothetical protein
MRANLKRFALNGAILMGAGIGLAACAGPAQRIEQSLVRVGVPNDVARCMGVRLEQRLTRDQLRQLDQLARLEDRRGGLGQARLQEIGRALAGTDDPALVGEVVRTGIGCLI